MIGAILLFLRQAEEGLRGRFGVEFRKKDDEGLVLGVRGLIWAEARTDGRSGANRCSCSLQCPIVD